MPVIAKAEKIYLPNPEDLISRHHVSGFHHNPSLPPTVLLNGNTLSRSIFIFKAHHRACAERRKHGVSYELQVEAFRTGKYLEKLDCSTTTTKHSHSTTKEPEKHSQVDQETTYGPKTEPMDTHSTKQSPTSPIPQPLIDSESTLKTNSSSAADQPATSRMICNMSRNQLPSNNRQSAQSAVCELESRVSIKTEPGIEENTAQCTQEPVDHQYSKPTTLLPGGKNNGTGPPKTKRRRYSIPTSLSSVAPRSSSYSDDAGDDLSLSAEDCISGVISTPPIKPLEEGDEVMTTPSPTTNPPLIGSKPQTVRTLNTKSTTARSTPSPPSERVTQHSRAQPEVMVKTESNFTAKGDSLFQDLNDFTKVMEMVTKEQLAKERQANFSTTQQQNRLMDTSQRRSPPQRMMSSPPPYYPPGTQPANGGSRHIPISQHVMQQQFKYPVTPVPRRPSMQEGIVENRHLARPHSLVDMQVQKHPRPLNLSGASQQIEGPQLMSPTMLSTPQTPGYPEPVATHDPTQMNTQPPRTPTTPLEHFSAFPVPPASQLVQSPTQSRPFFPTQPNSYQYPPKHNLSSPAVMPNSVVSNWPQPQQAHSHLSSPQNSLNESLLARVNSRLEMLTGHKRPPPALIQGWSGTGHANEMAQFSNQFPVTAPDSNPTGLPSVPSSMGYHNHSSLSYNHHPPL